MRRVLTLLALVVVAVGCKSLKEQQLPAYVGDTQTKQYSKNVASLRNKIPENRRVYFSSVDEAMQQGFSSSNEGSGDDSGSQ